MSGDVSPDNNKALLLLVSSRADFMSAQTNLYEQIISSTCLYEFGAFFLLLSI